MKNIIELVRSLGLQSIGEGVESGGCLDLLAELGCDPAQGFHLGVPMSSDAVLQQVDSFTAEPALSALG